LETTGRYFFDVRAARAIADVRFFAAVVVLREIASTDRFAAVFFGVWCLADEGFAMERFFINGFLTFMDFVVFLRIGVCFAIYQRKSPTPVYLGVRTLHYVLRVPAAFYVTTGM
jgi:hypothetical protein